MLQLATELVNLAYELGQHELFIYTKPEYEKLFQHCGFYLIAEAKPNVVLLENSRTRLAKQRDRWAQMRVAGEKIGAIVMNANPFTLGHRYLVEQALSQCEHLHMVAAQVQSLLVRGIMILNRGGSQEQLLHLVA